MAVPASDEEIDTFGIQKRMISFGRGELPSFPKGCKVFFHYLTKLADGSEKIIDDSRKQSPLNKKEADKVTSKPMELVFGKGFKLEVWELCLKTMCVGEVSSFTCNHNLVSNYPLVAAQLRSIALGKPQSHSCAMSVAAAGVGYSDLDELLQDSKFKLEFTFELVKYEPPESYQQDSWMMTEDERLKYIPILKAEGNKAFIDNDLDLAMKKYGEALHLLEQLSTMEKPGTKEFDLIDEQSVVFHLNLAECLLRKQDYYGAIKQCDEVLCRDQRNVKAYFRRCKAYMGVWDEDHALQDAKSTVELDGNLRSALNKELKLFKTALIQKQKEEKQKFQSLFEVKVDPNYGV